MKKFEPHYRLVRIGVATKIEKASRQQRMSHQFCGNDFDRIGPNTETRQATQEQGQNGTGYGKDEGGNEGQEEEVEDVQCWGKAAVVRWKTSVVYSVYLHVLFLWWHIMAHWGTKLTSRNRCQLTLQLSIT